MVVKGDEFMKRNFKWLIVGIVFSLIITSSVAVFAENRSIQVFFNNIKISINGTNIETDTEPFIYNGRTYVPVRFIAENLNMDVKYNEMTDTVEITNKNEIKNVDNIGVTAFLLDEYKALGDLNNKLSKFNSQIITIYFEHYLYKDEFSFDTISYDLDAIKKDHIAEVEYVKKMKAAQINTDKLSTILSYHSEAIELYEKAFKRLQIFSANNDFAEYNAFIDNFFKANEIVDAASSLINSEYEKAFQSLTGIK